MFAENTTVVKGTQYSIEGPLVTVYNVIDDIKLLDEVSNNPFIPGKLVEIGIHIIKIHMMSRMDFLPGSNFSLEAVIGPHS